MKSSIREMSMNRKTRRRGAMMIVAGFSSLVLSPSSFSSSAWPEFRGPTKDGHSDATRLPLEWSPEKNVVWKTPLPGKAWSSPIVAGGRIYLTNAVAAKDESDPHDARSLRVLALDAANGKVVWDTEVFVIADPSGSGGHHKNSFASPTPVFDNGMIYAHFGHFGTACVDAGGKVMWRTQELAYKPVHGNGGCPVVVDDLLIFNADAQENPFIAALDKATGKLRWRVPRESDAKKKFSFCTPLLIEVGGARQLITPGSNVVSALNPGDGSEIWRVRYEGYSVVPRPVYAQGLVFLSTGFDRPVALAIRPDGKGDVTDSHVAWKMEKQVSHTPSMLVVGDDLFMVADKGLVTCADAKTGAVHWQERVAGPCSASPLYAGGRIYIQDEKGAGYVIKAARQLELLATNDLGEPTLASYAVSGENLIIRTQGAVYCIGNR
jgi:outer membrane protein assembly factor BamB